VSHLNGITMMDYKHNQRARVCSSIECNKSEISCPQQSSETTDVINVFINVYHLFIQATFLIIFIF